MDVKMRPVILPFILIPALRDQRMTELRLSVRPPYYVGTDSDGHPAVFRTLTTTSRPHQFLGKIPVTKTPFNCGDILYVREPCYKDAGRYLYKADYPESVKFYLNGREITIGWCPPVAMFKEAARFFLYITGITIERLKDISEKDAIAEGVRRYPYGTDESRWAISPDSKTFCNDPIAAFSHMWNSHIPPEDAKRFGWGANPWVYAIRFKQISREKAYTLLRG